MRAHVSYADAGVDVNQLEWSDVRFEFEDGAFVYDVSFGYDGWDFDYTLRADEGAIIDRDLPDGWRASQEPSSPAGDDGSQAAPAPRTGGSAQEGPQAAITADDAVSIALEHAGVDAASARVTKQELERDDGHLTYDVQFVSGTTEWDYEVDAESGAVLSHETESVYD